MKIFFNREPIKGPWGGGNKTLTTLVEKLGHAGHEIVYTLETGIDIIFCFDPRVNKHGEDYTSFLNYKNNTSAKIFQRVGDVGTHGKPELTELVQRTTKFSDHVFFPSLWAKEYIKYDKNNFSIIENAPLDVFYKHRSLTYPDKKLKIVTHHWSTNLKKGFKYYKFIDEMCSKNIDFTFIGRLPPGFKFNNCKYIGAMGDNEEISRILASKDVYLTASEEEAGANHVLEALAAGLPIVYHQNGGSVPEYCNKYGLGFIDPKSMVASIVNVANQYKKYKENVMTYDNSIDKTAREYLKVILQNEEN